MKFTPFQINHNIISRGAVLMAAVAFLPSFASGATVVNDPFTDGGRTNGTDPEDIQWYHISSTSLTVVNDAAGIGSGNALNAGTFGTFGRFAGVFGSAVTIQPNETLSLTFAFRFTTAPTAGNAFRFGLYNNGGTPFTADNQTGATENNDFGYGLQTDAGSASATGTSIAKEAAGDNILGGSIAFATVGTAGQSFNLGTTAHTASYNITRSADGGTLILSGSIDGGTPATFNEAAPSTFTFHEVGFGQGGSSNNFRIDNVLITVVPEPSSVAMLGLGAAALLGVRRRDRSASH